MTVLIAPHLTVVALVRTFAKPEPDAGLLPLCGK
jgi:hypothetical protein